MIQLPKKSFSRQYAVLGLGRFGRSFVHTLIEQEFDVLAVDINPALVHEAASYATHVVQADITDENDMASLGIGNFEIVIIAVGEEFEAALMATMIAKEKGAGYVLVKAGGLRQKKILESVGADRVVLPEIEMAERVALSLTSNNILDYINLSDEYSIAEITPRKEWIDKSLAQARIREQHHLTIIAIKSGNELFVSPRAQHVIHKDDTLVVVGTNDAITDPK